jgi:aspartoacylase
MSKIKRVLIAGGTHGNELNGVYAVRKYERCPELIHRPSFETLTVLGNPRAIEAGVRYIDKDLNRCFDIPEKAKDVEYEIQRAREIKNQFGQAGQMPVDFAIDQHGTDSNAGLMLILDNLDCFTLELAAYLSDEQPALKVYSSTASGRRHDSLRSIAKYGVGIEVGPVAHGTLHAELFQKTETLVCAILDYLEQHNSNTVSLKETSLTVYQYAQAVDYPRDNNGEIQAMIHPQLQFKDYEALNPGDPMFLTFDGDAIAYSGNTTAYPIFINEAAYYEKGIAMYLTQKQQFQVS